MTFLSRVVLLLLVVLLVDVLAGRDKGRRKKKPGDANEAVEKLTERVEELEQKVESAHGSDGSCHDNNVHFFFHGGDDHDHDHSDDDTHVHVDLHLNDHGRSGGDDHYHHDHIALCKMENSDADGAILIVQGDDERTANFHFHFDHLGDANSEHDIHVHQFGDISNNCRNVGKHYNPYHKVIDVGDLGTLQSDENGAIDGTWKNDTHLTLFGEYSIMGRSMMVHDSDGNVACCVISVSPETHDHDMDHSHEHYHFSHDHSAHVHSAHDHSHQHSAHDHSHDHSGHHHGH